MLQTFLYYFLLQSLFSLLLSAPSCIPSENFCKKCDPLTNLCIKCEKKIYSVNKNGGCDPAKTCSPGENYCNECSENNILCKICDEGMSPDENGGCSFISNCEISYKGECLKCKENYIFIGGMSKFKICKNIYSEDLKNCKEINEKTGKCDVCENNYYLNADDKKCSLTESCSESNFGICSKCIKGFYLNKNTEKCIKKKDGLLNYCSQSIDDETCIKCIDDDYYLSSNDNQCVHTNFCLNSENSICTECLSGYILTKEKNTCVKSDNCYEGDNDTGYCLRCEKGFYLDLSDMLCKSNINEFKNCAQVNSKKICNKCELGYYLDGDNNCINVNYCLKSENGICTKCEDFYYLGLDHICSPIAHCVYSSLLLDCLECEDNYYLNSTTKVCDETNEKFSTCKVTYNFSDGNIYCQECKNGYYLSIENSECVNNENEKENYYKCKRYNETGKICMTCEKGYFLGELDNKCTKNENCDISEGEKCIKCKEFYCLDVKKNKCFENFYTEEELEKFYYSCNKSNEEGNECEICKNEKSQVKNGLCYNFADCEYAENGECFKCKENNEKGVDLCLNKDFGCVETYISHCLICNDSNDFGLCDECEDGYKLDEEKKCVEE